MSGNATARFVRSVAGDLPAESLHHVDCHDHLFLDLGCSVPNRGEMLLDSEEETLDELSAFRAAGGGGVLCATPIALGRRPAALSQVSNSSGVPVIASGGFHKSAYYPPDHWVQRYPLVTVAELVHEDATLGIDAYDYAGPRVERTEIRPGVLKAGADFWRLAGREADLHRIVAEVAFAIGLPVILHIEHGADPHPALDVIASTGLELDRVLVSHLDRTPDAELHASVAARGAYLVYDGLYRERYRPVGVLLDVIESLASRGHLDQLLLGGDLASRKLRRVAGAPGVAGLLTVLAPRIRARLGDEVLEQLLTSNPRRALALGQVRSTIARKEPGA